MWRVGPEGHSMLRFYRFFDPALEHQYQEAAAARAAVPLRIYTALAAVLATQEVIFNVNTLPEWVLYYFHVAILLLSLGLFIGSWLVTAVRRNILSIQTMFCLLLATYYGAMIPLNGALNGRGQIVDYEAVHGRMPDPMRALVMDRTVMVASMFGILYTFVHFVAFALQGLNAWTCVAYVMTVASYVIGLYQTPPGAHGLLLACTIIICAGWVYIAGAIESSRRSDFYARVLLRRELQASQMADTVLNHMLKNTLADVSANLELFFEGALDTAALGDSLACLRRAIRSCKDRQVFLKLVSGEYSPVLNKVNLRQFGQQLVVGRQVVCDSWDGTVLIDAVLYSLILDNALSNAVKHGHPTNPDVRLEITDLSDETAGISEGHTRICFRVSNAAHPDHAPLTPRMATQLFNPEPKLRLNTVRPVLSDGVGLGHSLLAAKLAGITLSLAQADSVVTFTAWADVPIVAQAVVDVHLPPEGPGYDEPWPSGVRFACIDDSLAALRLLEFHLKRACSLATVQCFGRCESEVQSFLDAALCNADVAILDQHLEFGGKCYLGTDLARQLVANGFHGLICIRSADDCAEDRTLYKIAGAHCSFGKDMLGAEMVSALKAAYLQFRPVGPTRGPSSPGSPCSPPRWQNYCDNLEECLLEP